MEKLLGANWRTSVNGLVETLCLIIIGLCVLPAETWQQPRVWIPASGLIIAKTIKDFITKDRKVTGGVIQQTADGEVSSRDPSRSTSVCDTITATPKS